MGRDRKFNFGNIKFRLMEGHTHDVKKRPTCQLNEGEKSGADRVI